MLIEITYNVTDVFMSTTETPVYVEISFEQPGGSAAVWGSITGTLSNQTDLQNALNLKVPYTGATTNVNLGEYELKAGQVTLDTSPTGTAAVGTIRWNDTTGTSETTLKGGNVIIKNGVDLVARVVNKVSPNTTLTKAAYQAVRVSGAQGQRLAIELAQANNDAGSADTIGLVTETIAPNQEGFIMTVGQLEGINTTGSLQGETWVDGDVLYLSPTTAGAITNVKPTGATGHLVIIGYVEYAHANNGKLYIKVANGFELDELHNVSIVTPTNNQGLFYNSSNSLWENKTISTALGYTPVPTTRNITINGVTYDLSADRTYTISTGISGSGAAGQVTYWTGASAVSGSNNLFWDNTNSRLGIGTNVPITTFHVSGISTFTGTTVSDGGQLGSELLNSSNWTNTGWTGDFSTGFTHTTGNTDPLTNTLSAVIGSYYQISIIVTNRTAGTYDISFGGVTLTGYGPNGTLIVGPRATSTNNFILTPSSTFDGTIRVSIKLISAGIGTLNLANSSSTIITEIRATNSNTNTFIGVNAGSRIINGINNIGLGLNSLQNITTGNSNIAIGNNSLNSMTIGARNIAFGHNSLLNNTSGLDNLGIGASALQSNTTGGNNVAVGSNAAISNTTGGNNVSIGNTSLYTNTTGGNNVAVGHQSLYSNTTGSGNTGVGFGALTLATTASNNIALGVYAGRWAGAGSTSNQTSNNSIYVGYQSRASANGNTNEIVIGYNVVGNGSNTTVLGNSSTTSTWLGGNLLLGTTTDGGQRLQVIGDTLLRGSGATSATTALTVQNSSSTNLFSVRNDRTVTIHGANITSARTDFPLNVHAGMSITATATSGDGLALYAGGANITDINLYIRGGGYMGTRSSLRLGAANNTDVVTEITNTWLSIAAGTTTRSQINLAASTAPTTPNNGDIWFDGTNIKMRIGGVTKTFTLI